MLTRVHTFAVVAVLALAQAQTSTRPPEVAVTIPQRSIARAVGLIVFIERDASHAAGRRVTGITRPSIGANGEYVFDDLAV